MEIEHYIITRFWNKPFSPAINLFDNKILIESINLLKRFLIPSLENQTDKKFTHIIVINEKHKEMEIFNELMTLKANYNLLVLTNTEFENFRKNIKTKNVIISRIDLDDAVFKDAVVDTKNHFDIKQNVKFYGYRYGITLEDKNYNECYETNVLYPGGGTNSQFQSLMFNDFQNYTGNLFYDHSNVYAYFKENNIPVNQNTYEINNFEKNAYVWVIRDNAMHIIYGQKRRTSDNKIIMDNKSLHLRFGI